MNHIIPRIDHPEIVIGLVAPIGTPLRDVVRDLTTEFSGLGYRVVQIKVTDIYDILKKYIIPEVSLDKKNRIQRFKTYIKYGNQLRRRMGDNSILAAITVSRIVNDRLNSKSDQKFSRTVYIINQFKRPEEIELFRSVYGKVFFQLSVYSRRSARVDYLSRQFAEDSGRANPEELRAEAEDLVNKDQNQQYESFGQRVGKVFHNADFIVNRDAMDPPASKQIERFVELLFSANFYTPTFMEYGMFAAKSAALRTADLSRQVGAGIFSRNGEIIALGSNEVPKAGGGTYWPGQKFDDREYKREYDSNDVRKKEILTELLNILGVDYDNIDQQKKREIDKAALMDALEYGRIVHAEMSALSDAARIGRAVKDAILYTTTFPCHLCAKHIVASGISEVVFLEPYPKSLTLRLHSDSVKIENHDRGDYSEFPYVEFNHFYGVTPRRYREIFEREKRKDDSGNFERYIGGRKIPYLDIKSPFYAQLEEAVLLSVRTAIDRFGISEIR